MTVLLGVVCVDRFYKIISMAASTDICDNVSNEELNPTKLTITADLYENVPRAISTLYFSLWYNIINK